MKYEIEKLLRQRKLYMIVTVLFLAVYVYLAFSGSYDTFSGYSLEYFWNNEEYRQQMMSQKTEWVDEAWKEKTIESYRTYALEVLGKEKYNCKEYQNEAYLFVEYNEEYYQGLSKYIDEAYEKYNNDNKMSLLDELNRRI